MSALDATGRADDTLVIFISDNGGAGFFGANNGDLAGQKQEILEGGIRVPMGARWTGRIPAGSQSDRVATTIDLFPAFCEAAASPSTGASTAVRSCRHCSENLNHLKTARCFGCVSRGVNVIRASVNFARDKDLVSCYRMMRASHCPSFILRKTHQNRPTSPHVTPPWPSDFVVP